MALKMLILRSKLEKAKSLGVKIISEEQFLEMIK